MRIYKATAAQDYYLYAFLSGVSLRNNCYSCVYARPERVSDITVGDFIGLGKAEPFDYDARNVSSVFINTVKGEKLYAEMLKEMPDINSVQREYSERLEYGPSLRYPFPKHRLSEKFRKMYKDKQDFSEAIRIVMKREMVIRGVKHYLSNWTLLYRIPRKIYRLTRKKLKL